MTPHRRPQTRSQTRTLARALPHPVASTLPWLELLIGFAFLALLTHS